MSTPLGGDAGLAEREPGTTGVMPSHRTGGPVAGLRARRDELRARGEQLRARIRGVVNRRPTVGPGPAAGAVVQDLRALVQAELALAQAELAPAVKAKGIGAGLFGVAGVAAWLGLQGLLVTLGLVLALFLPGWAAALIVTLLLLAVAGIAALIGKRQLARPVRLDTTTASVQEDIAWLRQHLPRR